MIDSEEVTPRTFFPLTSNSLSHIFNSPEGQILIKFPGPNGENEKVSH
jgi:hypothetical protein